MINIPNQERLVKKYGTALEASQLASILSKHVDLDKLTVEKIDAITGEEMAQLQKAYKDITGTTAPLNDAKVLAKGKVKAITPELICKVRHFNANQYCIKPDEANR